MLAQALEPLKVGNIAELLELLNDPTIDQEAQISALQDNVEAARTMIDTASSTIGCKEMYLAWCYCYC